MTEALGCPVPGMRREETSAATHLRCQVVPGGQVLEPEEAVPVPGAAPTRVVLDHLAEGEGQGARSVSHAGTSHTNHSPDRDQRTHPDNGNAGHTSPGRDTASPGRGAAAGKSAMVLRTRVTIVEGKLRC